MNPGQTTAPGRQALKLALTYALLALLATLANIGTQDLAMRLYGGPHALVLAMAAGTGAGLVLKYALDKRYIFRFRARSLGHDSRTFALYTAMGLATTAVFWSVELAFHWLYATPGMRYLGAALGLALGYVIKYYLDKRYVFLGAPATETRIES